MIAQSPMRAKAPKVPRSRMTVLTPEQALTLLDGLRHTRVYWPTLLALATGTRRGEILALRWHGVDFDHRLVRVTESLEETRPTKGSATLRFKSTKSSKARVVTLPGFALDELRRHKREQAEQLLALGVRQSGETLVCPREDGAPMVPESLTHEFTRLAARIAGLPRVTFHSLRHMHMQVICSRPTSIRRLYKSASATAPSPSRWIFTRTLWMVRRPPRRSELMRHSRRRGVARKFEWHLSGNWAQARNGPNKNPSDAKGLEGWPSGLRQRS